MSMLMAILCYLLAGFGLGVFQSFLVGLAARSWTGGTGLLWGSIIALTSGVIAMFLGWWGIVVATALPVLVGLASAVSLHASFQDPTEPPTRTA
jgi:hypothetical protein